MQKILIVGLIFTLAACNSEDKKEPEAKTAIAAETAANLPYTATYSSKFEMGDAKNSETVLTVWKAWDDGNLGSVRKLFADTVHLYFRGGNSMEGNADSVLTGIQNFRNTLSAVKNTIHAFMPVKSTDKNENWVCLWATEVITDKQGKTDSTDLQETWRLNKDGKIDLVYQFGRALVPAPMSK